MNQEGIINALKGLTFSGNDEDWSRWSKSFLISADVKGYRELLTGEVEIPTKYEEDNSKHETIRKNNFLAIKDLAISVQDNISFSIVSNAKNCYEAWLGLKDRYQKTSIRNKLNLRKKFRERNLNIGEDPDVWLTELEEMRNELEFEYNEVTDEDDFKLMVIGGLTDDYEALQSQLEYDFEKMGSGLSLSKIKAQIRIRYSRV